MTLQQQERRALNDGIEDVFMETSRYSAGIRTYYEIRRGTIKDLFEEFYFNFSWLVELTEGLEELSKEKEIFDEINNWLDNSDNVDMKARCESGRNIFKKFKTRISAKGLLALPARGR